MKLADIGVQRLSLEISTSCNIRCTFCPIDLRSAPSEFMKLETVKSVLDQLARDASLEMVAFQFLNEPLLHPEVDGILHYAHSVGLKTFISTNGTVLTAKAIDLLARRSPTLLKISVQDVNPKTFRVVKGTKMSYEEFLKRIANVVERRLTDRNFTSNVEMDVAIPIRIDSRMFRRRSWIHRALGLSPTDQTINDANRELIDHIVRFLEYLEKEARAPVEWQTFNPDLYNVKSWTDGYVPTARLGPGMTLELKAFYDWIGIDKKRPITYGACPRLSHLVINYKGDLQLCCVDTHGKTAIGNVFQESIASILSKPQNLAKVFRAPGFHIPTEHCRSCLGAPTRRGVALLDFNNRFRRKIPRFVPERQRDAVDALARLKDAELVQGNRQVVSAIDESLEAHRPAVDEDLAPVSGKGETAPRVGLSVG